VGRRRPACPGDRGGARIPSLRAWPLRLAAAVAAAALAGVLAVVPLLGAGHRDGLLAAPAAAALLGVAGALAGVEALLGVALVGFATEFATRSIVSGSVGPGATIGYAVALLVVCELVAASLAFGTAARVDAAVVVTRAQALGLAALVGAAAASLALLGAGVRLGDALDSALLGVAATNALLALAYLLSRRPASM
jgi:hypothetical protein